MRQHKHLLYAIAAVILCVAMLCCTGCKKPEEPKVTQPPHTHSYSKTWKSNETTHWKICYCGEKSSQGKHEDKNEDGKCDACEYGVEIQDAEFATAEQMKKVVLTKTATAGGAVTAHPGGRIAYSISVTNNNDRRISVKITDTVPEGTVFVDGCSNVSGSTLSWELKSIGPGETASVVYSVMPNYTLKAIREGSEPVVIKGTDAKVMDQTVSKTEDIFISETFNTTDRRRMEMAINAMVNANLSAYTKDMEPMKGMTLASMMYTVGFSAALDLPTDYAQILTQLYDSAEVPAALRRMVVPTLYGGTAVPAAKDSLFRGTRAAKVQLTDLMTGDLVVAEKNSEAALYIFDGRKLLTLGEDSVSAADESVLSGLPQASRYAVLRPAVNLNTHYSLPEGVYFNDADKDGYTDMETALVKTAEAYLLRGDRVQYSADYIGKAIDRAQSVVKQPEDYTTDQYGYLNSAYFTRDVHWATYGQALTAKTDTSYRYYSTIEWILGCAAYKWDPVELKGGNTSSVFYYECPVQEADGKRVSLLTDAEKKEVMEQFNALLRPGDVICYGNRTGSAGCAMIYAGNGLIIYAGGDNYVQDNKTDSHEASIRFMAVSELFDQENHPEHYVFLQDRFSITRTQQGRGMKVTDNAKNRVENMDGIIAEKISSTAMGKTVSSGDEITYTFYIFNTNGTAKTFNVVDTLSEFVTFVSATDNGKAADGKVTWAVEVPADTRISISYTVKVKDNVPAYTKIDGGLATINGVKHSCYNTYVVNTLTTAEQQTLVAAVNTVKGMDITGLNSVQVANLIYKTAFGVDNIFGENVTDFGLLFNGNGADNTGVFCDSVVWANDAFLIVKDANTSAGSMMVAPGMFGGQYAFNGYTSYNGHTVDEPYLRYTTLNGGILRSRYYQERDLVIGDIFLLKSSSQQFLYLYVGKDIFVSLGEDLTAFAETSVSQLFQYAPADVWKYHAVLRPSMVLDI